MAVWFYARGEIWTGACILHFRWDSSGILCPFLQDFFFFVFLYCISPEFSILLMVFSFSLSGFLCFTRKFFLGRWGRGSLGFVCYSPRIPIFLFPEDMAKVHSAVTLRFDWIWLDSVGSWIHLFIHSLFLEESIVEGGGEKAKRTKREFSEILLYSLTMLRQYLTTAVIK